MHLGNVFSALMAWLSARVSGGEILLRIEDLDLPRCPAENTAVLRRDLKKLGFDWDCEQPNQSTRSDYYEEILEKIASAGVVFPCWCTRGDLKNAPNAPHASDGHPIYPGLCHGLSEKERSERMKRRAPLWRLAVPDEEITFTDGHYGEYRENLARECGDFILRRADGVFAYQLAVTADDMAAGVTQVVRGRDLISSTPRQIYIYRLLGAEIPQYSHVPLLTDTEGRRLSKRDRDLDLGVLFEKYAPEELIGKLAFAAGLIDSETPCRPDELISVFDWARVPQDDIQLKL